MEPQTAIVTGASSGIGLGEKSLHRMLNRNGNPTARNLGLIVKSILTNNVKSNWDDAF